MSCKLKDWKNTITTIIRRIGKKNIGTDDELVDDLVFWLHRKGMVLILDCRINIEELVLDSSKRRRVLDLDRFVEIKSVMNGFEL